MIYLEIKSNNLSKHRYINLDSISYIAPINENTNKTLFVFNSGIEVVVNVPFTTVSQELHQIYLENKGLHIKEIRNNG